MSLKSTYASTSIVADKQSSKGSQDFNGKPQVWVRLRPMSSPEESFMAFGEDGKTIRVVVDPEDRPTKRSLSSCRYVPVADGRTKEILNFSADGILRNSSQEETFRCIVEDVVLNAMNGTPGVIVCLGPEDAGKTFTLVGKSGKFPYRGVLQRSLEKIFEIIATRQDELGYTIRLSVVEVHHNRVRDLLTTVGGNRVRGQICRTRSQQTVIHYENVQSVENGLVLLMLGLAAQKNTPREPISKYHTIVCLDICAQPLLNDGSKPFQSRITFAEIASIPKRSSELDSPPTRDMAPYASVTSCNRVSRCSLPRAASTLSRKSALSCSPRKARTTCTPLGRPQTPSTTPVSEAIEVRKDLFLLEQMFERANEIRKLSNKMKPKISTSQYFRQCKLANCLQDIISPTSEVRIILNVRPEREFLQRTLEAMRFASRAENVAHELVFTKYEPYEPPVNAESLRNELSLIQKDLAQLQEETPASTFANSPNRRLQISDLLSKEPVHEPWNPNRVILMEVAAYLDGKLGELQLGTKAQVKTLLEVIRQMWQHTSKNAWQQVQKPSTHQMTQFPEDLKVKRKKSKTSFTTIVTQIKAANSKSRKGLRTSGEIQEPTTPPVSPVSPRKGKSKRDRGKDNGRLKMSRAISASEATSREDVSSPRGADDLGQEDIPPFEKSNDEKHSDIWNRFLETEEGKAVVQEFNNQDAILQECLGTMNKMLQPTASHFMNAIHKFVQVILQDERLKKNGKTDPVVNEETYVFNELKFLNTNCDELVQKMVDLCGQALEQQTETVERCKVQCEQYFVNFAKEHPELNDNESLTISNIPEAFQTAAALAQEQSSTTTYYQNGRLRTLTEDELAKHYADISRHAHRHAKQLLKFYSQKQPWDNSFVKTSC